MPEAKLPELKEDELEIYVLLNMKVQKQNKHVQTHLNTIRKICDFNTPKNMQFSYNYDKEQGVVTIQGIIHEDERKLGLKKDSVPDSLQDTLRTIEQGFRAQLGFNFAFKEFLEKKSCFDMLFKGFRYQSEVSFLRKIKKVMLEAFKDAESRGSDVAQTVAMLGPLFSINSDIKVDLTHSDLEEILSHEHLKKLNFDINKLLKMITDDADTKEVKTKNFDLEDLGMSVEKLEKSGIKINEADSKRCYHDWVLYRAMIELLNLSTEDF